MTTKQCGGDPSQDCPTPDSCDRQGCARLTPDPTTRPGSCSAPECTERALHYSLWCAVHDGEPEPLPLFAAGAA